MQNNKNYKIYSLLFGVIISSMTLFLVVINKAFSWDYFFWLITGIFLIFCSKSKKIEKFFSKGIETRSTDIFFQEFTEKFLILFSLKIILDILMRYLQGFILYINILEIFVMIFMACLIGKSAYEFGKKKIYWIFGLLGFIWFMTLGILLGYLSILELKTEKDEDRI
ncbi:TPA: hypothetical protein DD449_01430 [Candidatus Berkelbacteria bacterium]|uniref:Uncharacterized protein n=1 Tax=Berkelbacteria bacterium GW2011_GWE1_39_12 TaxID=1618337 RepID=A0A0G4B4P4_9BACT|nr:MAG: hypothetical protein UT28_C0001G0800 [Berkelbacteria bacterium GW2011_GWE1_39_12]HBO60331.1 hypothetical protein [Candidatus Berkelbacteria bacterium]